jgi:8-oxo-dGTP pyrophosphatase MutT (NUDIX family)
MLSVSIEIMISRFRQVLSQRKVNHITGTDRIAAAVLIPVYRENDEYYIIFTRRTHQVSTHKGQISFPGGARDPGDISMLDTALRECTEEVGIACTAVDILGELDDFATHVSYFVISPYVGLIPWPYEFTLSEWETAEIIRVPISALLDKTCMSEGNEIMDEQLVPSCFYTYNGNVIWGATARILKQFLEIWRQAGKITDS